MLGDLRRNCQGLALDEFALTAPFFIQLYRGSYQVNDAVGCNRRVTIAARSVADLTSQFATVTPASEAAIGRPPSPIAPAAPISAL